MWFLVIVRRLVICFNGSDETDETPSHYRIISGKKRKVCQQGYCRLNASVGQTSSNLPLNIFLHT